LPTFAGRWRQGASILDERARRLFAVNEALARGHRSVMATSIATGLARSAIDREIQGCGPPATTWALDCPVRAACVRVW
jgi:hypothetical protein